MIVEIRWTGYLFPESAAAVGGFYTYLLCQFRMANSKGNNSEELFPASPLLINLKTN